MIYELIFLSTELDILDLRLHSLHDVIDKHIIFEYPFNHGRKPCKMYYNENKERFKEFEHKIIHIIDDGEYSEKDYSGGSSGLGLMWNRRNSKVVSDVMKDFSDDDFVFGFDGDAIPDRKMFETLDITRPSCLYMRWSTYWFNFYSIGEVYAWSVAVPYREIKKVGCLGNIVGYTPEEPVQYVSNAGWHLSKCGGVDMLIENIKGYPHQEFADNPALIDPVQVQDRINNGWHWNDHTNGVNGSMPNMVCDPYKSEDWPNYLNEHPEIFGKYFKGGMNV